MILYAHRLCNKQMTRKPVVVCSGRNLPLHPASPTNHDFICASFVQQANDAEAGGRLLWSQLASSSGITISSITFDPFTASTVSAWNL
jgi:hypothetical protein